MKQKKFIVFLIFVVLLLAEIISVCAVSINYGYNFRTGMLLSRFLSETEENAIESVVVILFIAVFIAGIVFITSESEIIGNIINVKCIKGDECNSGFRHGYLFFRKNQGEVRFVEWNKDPTGFYRCFGKPAVVCENCGKVYLISKINILESEQCEHGKKRISRRHIFIFAMFLIVSAFAIGGIFQIFFGTIIAWFVLSELILTVILFACYRIEISNGSQGGEDEKVKKNTAAKYIKALPEDFPEAQVELIKQKTEE